MSTGYRPPPGNGVESGTDEPAPNGRWSAFYYRVAATALGLLLVVVGYVIRQVIVNTSRVSVIERAVESMERDGDKHDTADTVRLQALWTEAVRLEGLTKDAERRMQEQLNRHVDAQIREMERMLFRLDALALACEALRQKR